MYLLLIEDRRYAVNSARLTSTTNSTMWTAQY